MNRSSSGVVALVAAALASVAPAAAATASSPARSVDRPSALGFVDARAGRSLDGAWHVIVDPYDNGVLDYRNHPRPHGYFEDAPPKSPSELVEYDFSRSPTLNVPGDWNTQRAELLYYEGSVWYERRFDYAAAPGRRMFVQFGAAAARATVWLNGRRLGAHDGGFTPFAFEVTDALRPRDNALVVQVDNTRRADALPAMNTDWWNYGGLTRSVRLVETPAAFVREAVVALARDNPGEVRGRVELDGAAGPVAVTIEIPEAGARATVTTDRDGRATFSFPARLALWSPESPKLYDVTISAKGHGVTDDVTDRVTDRIGFRTVATRGQDILLNGRSVFLRGISLHEEALGRGGRATSRADAEALLGLAKQLGCNFVRLAHYPHGDEMTRAADRMGLLVWSEIPVYWTIAWSNPDTLAAARRQLGEEIARDANRASVILWSVGNETPISAERTRFLRALVDDAHAADPTRLVTAALEHHYVGAREVLLDDPLAASLDVLGVNEYVGWYDGLPDKCDGLSWRTAEAKPIVISEFGADAKAGLHGEEGRRFTEEFQANVYRHQLAMLKRIAGLRGMSPWILVDFRSPRRPLAGIQDGWNRKGLVANDGTRKQAFAILREAYRALAAAPPSATPGTAAPGAALP
jgi:beta-glucuronidase